MTGRKRYRTLTRVWAVAVLVTVGLVYAGVAAPLVSPAQLPGGGGGLLVGGLALIAVGNAVLSRLLLDSFADVGDRIGLTPGEGSGISLLQRLTGRVGNNHPALTGRVSGREVRVEVVSKHRGNRAGGTPRVVNYTVVSSALAEPLEPGFLIGPDDGPLFPTLDVPTESLPTGAIDGRFRLLGERVEDAADAVLTTRVRNALSDVEGFDGLVVGDPFGAVTETVGDAAGAVVENTEGLSSEDAQAASEAIGSLMDGAVGSAVERTAFDGPEDDPRTVAIVSEGVTMDADTLQRRLEAVVAVADAVERADLSTSAPAE
jgi:hypothetical protein